MKVASYLGCLLIILLIACESSERERGRTKTWMMQNNKIKVLSTTAMINDLVAQVGGSRHVDALPLIQGNLDPHSYQLVKGDDEKFKNADLIFFNGLGLEHGASLQHTLEIHPHAIALGNAIKQKYPDKILVVDRQVDPHIWMDIDLFKESVPIIVLAMSQKDPAHAEEYAENGRTVLEKLRIVDQEIKARMQKIPPEKRYLVTSHDAFNYFTRAYLAEPTEWMDEKWRVRFQAPEGLAPDSQLSSADIQFIINHMKCFGIQVVFPESNVSQDSIRKLVDVGREKGIHVLIAEDPLYGDAMGPPGSDADTYPKMLEHNASVISKYLNQ